MEELKQAYRRGKLILFAGAGVSAGLGLPTWPELADEMARQLGYEPAEFSGYGDYRTLAEYYRIRKGLDSLYGWMASEWHRSEIDIRDSEIHRLIVEGRFQSIYTTNFDHWIEAAHEAYSKEFVKITCVADLARMPDGARQIVKFHGDLDDPATIVLDETSYFERLGFESPLDIKLRADVLGSSVLFVGYSISDINIRLLFHKLARIWDGRQNGARRPASYLFLSRPNPVAEAVLGQWDIKVLCPDVDEEPGQALLAFLRQLVH
nr:SIR2 family protein [Pseudomonas sp.]